MLDYGIISDGTRQSIIVFLTMISFCLEDRQQRPRHSSQDDCGTILVSQGSLPWSTESAVSIFVDEPDELLLGGDSEEDSLC